MARNQEPVDCPPGVWTELTNSDTTDITFQVQDGAVKIRVMPSDTPPAALNLGGYRFHARPADWQFEQGAQRVELASYAAAVTTGRVFATPISRRAATVIVDHA